MTTFSDAKRLTKEELQNYQVEFTVHEDNDNKSRNSSKNHSVASFKDVMKGSSTDESSLNRFHTSATDLSSKVASK